VTSPARLIDVRCPACGTEYETWHRPSINLDLDPGMADPAYLDEASTATCPNCGLKVRLGVLVVAGGGRGWSMD
jgi:predicted RNA-binding Zn-ribbon protein involved in translation (DUF1610 family)